MLFWREQKMNKKNCFLECIEKLYGKEFVNKIKAHIPINGIRANIKNVICVAKKFGIALNKIFIIKNPNGVFHAQLSGGIPLSLFNPKDDDLVGEPISGTTLALLMGGSAVAGGGAGFLGSKAMNKNLKGGMIDYQPYSGYRPPEVGQTFRPVQDQITEILMKRSQGQDVGFDPRRRKQLMELYDLERQSYQEEAKADIINQLSGTGLSRNLQAREALLGRQGREWERQKSIYSKGVDVEDLTRRSEERDVNTARLQQLNAMNFAQENNRAQFDLGVYGAEQSGRYASAGINNAIRGQMQSPMGSAIQGGASAAMIPYMMSGGGGSPSTTPRLSSGIGQSGGGLQSSMQNILNDPNRLRLLKR